MRAIRSVVAVQSAVCLGVSLAAILAAGGGRNALIVQALAAVLALGLSVAVMRLWPKARWRFRMLLAACVVAAVWTLVSGQPLEGARRWLSLGPIQLHAASLILPIAAWTFSRSPGGGGVELLSIVLAAVLLVQQDAASSTAWALALAGAVWFGRRGQLAAWGVAAVAAVYSAWTFYGAGWSVTFWGLVLLAFGAPVYWLVRRTAR